MDTNETTLPGKIHLLFVDDEQQFLQSMSTRLSLRGFHVIAVDRGEKAIEAARGQRIDVALIDLKMPGMGGEETLVALKKEHPWMEIIILTGHGSIDSAVECAKVGAYSYLEKPCEWDRLVKALTDAYQQRVMNKMKLTEAKMEEMLKIAVSDSPLGVLRRLRELGQPADR
jgi:DNA-binding NtrC family response regulator